MIGRRARKVGEFGPAVADLNAPHDHPRQPGFVRRLSRLDGLAFEQVRDRELSIAEYADRDRGPRQTDGVEHERAPDSAPGTDVEDELVEREERGAIAVAQVESANLECERIRVEGNLARRCGASEALAC